MGNVRDILSRIFLKTDQLFKKQIRIEQAEKIHVHWSDIRILMEPSQFRSFFVAMTLAIKAWDGGLSPDSDKVLSHIEFDEEVVFNREVSIELQKDGNFHFHYNDLRIEMTPDTFVILANLFCDARKIYENI